ncbi:MAG: TonB-dependent receptor [Bacteroidota bacterium]
MQRQILETEQKALVINLNDQIYGTFSEIGAGQEVARHFFQVGAAAGTIAKTMSAYDKVYSDNIYGPEPSGRYVCESRLYRMLDHEYDLIIGRLNLERIDTNFFVFADTVSAINYQKTIKGSGWLGMRFQLTPNAEPNDMVVQVRMLDNDNQLQQQAIGILGVNMIYACYYYNSNPALMLQSLVDGIKGRVAIDLVRLSGPNFEEVDNRWLCLKLVEHGLTEVSMFGPDGNGVHASEFLYKKNVMVVRGSFRPPTLVNLDMIQKSFDQFRREPEVDANRSFVLTEITLDNLRGESEQIDEKDFLDRAELLCALGQTVIVSNCEEHHHLIRYLADYKVPHLGIVIGARELLEMITEKYYQNMEGELLSVFGRLFKKHIRFYVYPFMQEGSAELMTAQNLPIPEGVKFLYKHLLDNKQLVDIKNFDANNLHIFSNLVFQMITDDERGWEKFLPKRVSKTIKEKCLFGFPAEQMEFEY